MSDQLPITRPSDYAEMLEDTPAGNKMFKEYMINSVDNIKKRVSELEGDRPMVMSSVNTVNDVKTGATWITRFVAGIVLIGGFAYGVWEGLLKIVEVMSHKS